MESQPQNPKFRNNPETFHPCNHLAEEERELVAWLIIILSSCCCGVVIVLSLLLCCGLVCDCGISRPYSLTCSA